MPDIESSILSIVDAAVKDKVSADIVKAIHEKYMELQETKTQCKRAEKSMLIRLKARFDMKLSAFESEYRKLKTRGFSIPEVENYISGLKGYIDQLSIEKNR